MLRWFGLGKSDEQVQKEEERKFVLEKLKTVDHKKLSDFKLPKDYKEFLESEEGSGVGVALNFLWDGVRHTPEDMKKEIGIPILSGTMVNGMLKHQSYVRRVFQESCKEDVRNESIKISSYVTCTLGKIKLEDRKHLIQKVSMLCSARLFKTVSENTEVMAKRFTKNTKIPGLAFAVEKVLFSVAEDHERWGRCFASLMPVVYAKHLLSKDDFKKLQEDDAKKQQ